MARWLPSGLAIAGALCLALAGGARAQEDAVAEVRARASSAVALVTARIPTQGTSVHVAGRDAVSANTGFFVSSEGKVLTSLLGLAGCGDITVQCPDGRESPAEVVAVDQASGLALLRTDLRDTRAFEPAPDATSAGSTLWLASARRAGAAPSVALAAGPLLPARRSARLHGVLWEDLLQLSAPAEGAFAATPVVDARGRLAGVVLGVAAGERAGRPSCLVLPAGRLTEIVERLRRGESRRLGWLGVAVAQEPGRPEGVRVEAALENSPAYSAGIRPGDVLLQIDGVAIDEPAVLTEHVALAGPDRRVEIELLRGDRIETVQADLGARPLLICGGQRRPGEQLVRVRRPFGAIAPAGLPVPGARRLGTLQEENRRLRERVRELEERLRELGPPRP